MKQSIFENNIYFFLFFVTKKGNYSNTKNYHELLNKLIKFIIFYKSIEMGNKAPSKSYKNASLPTFSSSTPYLTPQTDKSISLNNQPGHKIYSFKTKTLQDPSYFSTYRLPQKITVMTYNVWFEAHNSQNRFQCIFALLGESKPDFICLQEVNQQFMGLLHSGKYKWLEQYYMAEYPMHWYDTVILSKYKCKFVKKPFQKSTMSRSLNVAEVVSEDGRNLQVGSVHYESLSNTQIRISQMEQMEAFTNNCQKVIIAGDYNFSDGGLENKRIPKEFQDLWIETHESLENSYTMPKTPRFPSWRPDHILCKGCNMKNSAIQKIGDFTIPPFEHQSALMIETDGIVRTPSDHFGLFSEIYL